MTGCCLVVSERCPIASNQLPVTMVIASPIVNCKMERKAGDKNGRFFKIAVKRKTGTEGSKGSKEADGPMADKNATADNADLRGSRIEVANAPSVVGEPAGADQR